MREIEKAVIVKAGVLYAGVATGGEDVEDVVLTTEGSCQVLVTATILLQPTLDIYGDGVKPSLHLLPRHSHSNSPRSY